MDNLGEKVVTHIENHVNREKNFVILKRKLEELNAVKEDNELAKMKQLLDPRKKLKKSAENWFRNVERVTVETNDLENEITRSNVLWSIGGKVLERIQEVEDLLHKGQNFDSLVIDNPQWIGQVLSTTTLFGEVPKTLMEEIWEHLMDDKVSKIGVYGMGGVGKTTIMKLIHNQLIEETEKFNKVVWVTVSKQINITKLQNDIQNAIGACGLLKDDDDQTVRAGKLCEFLSKFSGKYVLILDDLWDDLSLEDVGIPEPSNGSKLVITTRLLNVCHHLNCLEVKIPSLLQADAWSLFLEKVGHDILNYPDLLPIVEDVVDECDGLPLAIVVIASGMRRVRDTLRWRNALRELKEQVKSVDGKEEKIFQQLQFSYDRLEDEKLKLCFLCCAFYPEDFDIKREELINLWIAEGYVEEMSSLQAEIDKGHAILNKLKDSSLIEDGSLVYNSKTVKLHDIVRDMALRITSARTQCLVRAGMNLMKLPDLKEWKEDLEKVSLMRNWRLRIQSEMPPPNCPVLTTLLLSELRWNTIIPDRFFEQMTGLKILDLSRNQYIQSLPNSISHLESLTTLLLRGCQHLKEIPSLSKLQALKKLDLYQTGLKEFPHGLDELINLRYLNLSGTHLRKMNVGILANLTSLLHLQMIPLDYGEETKIELGGRAGIEFLLQLEYLEIAFKELDEFNSYMQALEDTRGGKGPRRFKIIMGETYYAQKICGEKLIAFEQTVICTENIKLPSFVEALDIKCIINRREDEVFLSNLITCCGNTSFSSLEAVIVDGCEGIRKLFPLDWILRNLPNLEFLCVGGSNRKLELNEIIGLESEMDLDEEPVKYCTLPRLKKLVLWDLPKLRSICSEKVSIVCDSIESIVIGYCPKLEKIPLIFPLRDDGLPSPPPSLKTIVAYPKEDWWETAEWYQPEIKSMVEHLVKHDVYSGDHTFEQ